MSEISFRFILFGCFIFFICSFLTFITFKNKLIEGMHSQQKHKNKKYKYMYEKKEKD